jgi:hypothetical protein
MDDPQPPPVNVIAKQGKKHLDGFFNKGWRPCIGWICSIGFIYQFVAYPLIVWYSSGWLHIGPPPPLDFTQLMTLLGTTGTMAGLRTLERVNGVIPPGQ